MANQFQTGNATGAAAKVPPAVRNANFTKMTRQFWQSESAFAGVPGGTSSFDLTKVRLSSKTRLLVTADLKVTHASETTYVPNDFAPYSMIRNARVDINNGFSPFNLSGQELYMYNLIRPMAEQMQRQDSGRSKVVQGVKASPSGAVNKISFLADLPYALNDRDPMGLIITQNQATTVTVSIDFNMADKLGSGQPGFSYELSNIVVTPVNETFAIPPIEEAQPDTSIIKLVQSSRMPINGSGPQVMKLTTGYTYRKLIAFISDANGKGVPDDQLSGFLEIVLNQADTPYRLTATHLAKINHEQFGYPLPQGMFAFDFSYQGISNLGGTRDYMDTERLTEFWIKFNAPYAGNISVVYEQLSLLR